MSNTEVDPEQTHTYQCPHCKKYLEIPDSLLGESIECPNCDGQIQVATPNARASEPTNASDQEVMRVPLETSNEDTLLVKNPAMFRKHPLWYLGYIVAVLLAAWASVELYFANYPYAAGLVALVGLVPLTLWVYWYLQVHFTRLTITNKRSIYREGVIARKTSEVLHDDVRNLQADQNVWERIVGIGDVAISSAGQSDLEIYIDGVPDPDSVTSLIRSFQD